MRTGRSDSGTSSVGENHGLGSRWLEETARVGEGDFSASLLLENVTVLKVSAHCGKSLRPAASRSQ